MSLATDTIYRIILKVNTATMMMMAQSRAESTWEINNYGKYINKSIQQYERINKKICRQKMSIIFNEICINEEMLPKYT